MIRTSKSSKWLSAIACLIVTASMPSSGVMAQNHQVYDSIAAHYKSEQAVYTNYSEKMVISEDGNGHLVANSKVTIEKLLLSDLSINNENTESFWYNSFSMLTDLDGVSLIPNKDGSYTRKDNCHFGEGASGDESSLSDSRYIVAYYSGLTKKSITQTTFSEDYTDLNNLGGFYFQMHIPTLKASYEIVVPKHVKMGFVLKGNDTSKLKRTEEERDGMMVYKFTASNIPALKEFSNVPRLYPYAVTHVIPYMISYKLAGAKKDTLLSANKDELYKHLYPFIKGINIHTDSFLNKAVGEITRNSYSQREKAANIYRWVQNNIHYFGFESGLEGFIPRQADTVFKRKYGDCKDMSSLLVAMCRKAGLNAYFTWIGTQDIPYSHDEMALPRLYNHMICALKLGDEWIFMDGTDKYLPFGANRHDIQGKEAMIAIDARNYKIVKVPVVSADKNLLTDNTTIKIDTANNDISGTLSQHYSGYMAWDIVQTLDNIHKKSDRDKFVRRLTTRGSSKYLIPQYNISANESGDMDVSLNSEYTIGDYVHHVGKQCIVNMNIKPTFTNNRINDADRNVPYYLDHTQSVKESVVLDIPAGYKVTYLPKPAQGTAEGLWSYRIAYNEDKKANKVTLTREYEINTTEIGPKQFEANNKLVDDLKNLYKETVVLTAKNKK